MKKKIYMDATSAVISEIEKNHHCVMERDNSKLNSTIGSEKISVKIYSDDRENIKKAWEDLKRNINIRHYTLVEDCEPKDAENATIYVSGLKESTTKDAVTLFFENKRRTGGGDLREGKEGYKRISDTVARLTFESSKGDWIFHSPITFTKLLGCLSFFSFCLPPL